LRETAISRLTERRLVQAYLTLFLIPAWPDGAKTVLLARFGAYEVRLVEIAQELSEDVPHLWIELYASDIQSALDSCGCDEFDDAVMAADDFMSRARQLHEQSKCS
jgi:hypothetical protein